MTPGEAERRRIEIVHESLLTKWPRLVHWQTQDAEGAQLRDELRQAAHLWDEHDRAEDFLWTGTAYREYQLWRERYAGSLTPLEDDFAAAMTLLATRKRRHRNIFFVAAFLLLAIGVATFAWLWRSGDAARRAAEASKLLALGELELAEDPGAALAYAIASLEIDDTDAGRMFALRALSQSPPPRVAQDGAAAASLSFSPKGDRLAAGGIWRLELHRRDGQPPRVLEEGKGAVRRVAFGPDGDTLVVREAPDRKRFGIWSLAAGRKIRSFQTEGISQIAIRGGLLYIVTFTGPRGREVDEGIVRRWGFNASEPERVGSWRIERITDFSVDGDRLLYARGRGIYARPLRDPPAGASEERLLGEHTTEVVSVAGDPWRPRVATGDDHGEVRVWSLTSRALELRRVLRGPGKVGMILFDPTGTRIAVSYENPPTNFHVWRLDAPEAAEPLVLRRRQPASLDLYADAAFTPDGRWLVTHQGGRGPSLNLFPLAHVYPLTLRGSSLIGFSPDGMYGLRSGELQVWDLKSDRPRTLWKPPGTVVDLVMNPQGTSCIVSIADAVSFLGSYLFALDTGSARLLPNASEGRTVPSVGHAFSGDGRLVVWTVWYAGRKDDLGIRIYDVATGRVKILEASRGELHPAVRLTSDGTLYSIRFRDETDLIQGEGIIFRWDLQTGRRVEVARLRPANFGEFAVTSDGRFLVAAECLSEKCTAGGNTPGRAVARLFDLQRGTSRVLTSHGDRINTVKIDSARGLLVTGSSDGSVRVGPLTGEGPYVLLGHKNAIAGLAIDPAGHYLASSEQNDPAMRVWPMPDMSKPPLQTLPHDKLLARLKSLTNLRVVADATSPTGYKLDVGPFPGWAEVPEW